ncbi:MAG: DUF4340 domain-containing protein [Bdellovibrionales bacterium]|nr:DUF4340 domain-containing protein [Bdellovibrionales bacterium]
MATKSPRTGTPLVLAVVLIALGGLAYWLQYSKKPADEAAEADAKKVLALKHDAVARLEFRGASKKPENITRPPLAVALECASLADKLCHPEDASHWNLVEPLKTKADDATVNGVLKNIGNLVSNETLDLATETPAKRAQLLKDYGLDAEARARPTTRKITVVRAGGAKTAVYFGVKHPIGDNVFALLETGEIANENKIYVVPDWQISVFDQKTSYFRDKNLFAFNEKDVSEFTLAQSKKTNGKLEAKRTAGADGKPADPEGWTLKLGKTEAEGDVDQIDAVLSGVSHLAAKDIAAENRNSPEGKAALAGAKLYYDLRFTAKGAEKHIRLYEKPKSKDPKALPALYAVVDDQDPVYEIDTSNSDRIQKTFDELRSGKLMTTAERYAISAIDVDAHGAESFKQQVTKEPGGKWKIGAAETGPGKVESFLDRLTGKAAIGFGGPLPTGGEFLKLTLKKSVDGKETVSAEFEFWKAKDRIYARNLRTPKKEVVELSPELGPELPWGSASWLPAPTSAAPKNGAK